MNITKKEYKINNFEEINLIGTLLMLFLNENYYCSPLILNDFMCGLNIAKK